MCVVGTRISFVLIDCFWWLSFFFHGIGNATVLFGGTCDQAPYNGALEIAMQKHVDRINADDYVPPLHTDNSSNENIE